MPVEPSPGRSPLVVVIDVTDTLQARWRAGIQRVVCQLVGQLSDARSGVEVWPVAWSPDLAGYRRLTDDERRTLLDPVAGPVEISPAPTQGPAGGGAAHGVRAVVARVRRPVAALVRRVVGNERLREWRRTVRLHTVGRDVLPLAVGKLPSGSVLLEADGVWNLPEPDREVFYPALRADGVHLVALVYDLIPLEHPEWFEASLVRVFERTLRSQARHAELVLAISHHTAATFDAWAGSIGAHPPPAVPIRLGADAAAPPPEGSELPAALAGMRYVLMVGTIEPRKNHVVVIDAFESLAAQHPDLSLVIVGRPGWKTAGLERRLESHPLVGTRLHWLRSVSDAELALLYRNALVVAVPSITEGFGLPIIEALGHGAPVVASDGGALVEAADGYVDHVAPDDVEGWRRELERHVVDPTHGRVRRDRLTELRRPSWADTADEVVATLVDRFGPT